MAPFEDFERFGKALAAFAVWYLEEALQKY
jgi:hypothetical protein